MRSSFFLPVLLYHNVIDYGCDITAVSKSQFEGHLRTLRDLGYSTCSLADASNLYFAGEDSPEKKVLIQFDDAYIDTLQVAAPILQSYDFNASVFVIVDYIGKTNIWDHRIDRVLSHMNIDDIHKWISLGFEIGSHTMTHHNLIKYSGSELQDELLQSKLFLQSQFKQSVDFLSYPYGAFDEKVKNMAMREYDFAFSVGDGGNNWAKDHHAIKRFQINRKFDNDDLARLLVTRK